ncbi:acyl-CoA dehydrogenase family protein [Streptomyces sp. DSM 41014]|uniref:Acyl-CoA dehydrogenase family protein n=1 Tax=Streptomyces hintoniae TaxID=3075521 RepID=A0ABU2UYV8_9ACTN|nr:acyl-CoA dehydrogenase family protein [Streptomyces sp. DSM 41014]MDT0477972.1 acyl-CoA dehydrogenase family protein [Streptomyces sp. DSM 41014]
MDWPTTPPIAPGFLELSEVLTALRAEAGDDISGRPSDGVLAALATTGVLRLPIATEYGGLGADWREANAVIAALARADASVAIIVFLHYAALSRIIAYGSDEQRKRLLMAVTRDDRIFASSWSEPGADAAKQNISTRATQRAEGGWELDGAKTFTTGAGVADLYLVLAQTGEGGAQGSYGRSNQGIFVVDSTQPGFVVDGLLDLSGMRRSATGLIKLSGYVAEAGDVLTHSRETPEAIGHPHTLGLTLGAVALGVAEEAHDTAVEVGRRRDLLESPLYRHHLFELGSQLAAVRGVVESATGALGDRTGPALTAKVFGSETAEAMCRTAQALAGSAAFSRGHALNRLAQDARALTLMGPPNYLCRELVAARVLKP